MCSLSVERAIADSSHVDGDRGASPPGVGRRASFVSIVIPCFDEEEVLPELFRRVQAVAAALECEYEVVVVDDGSRDKTWSLLCDIHQRDRRWKLVRLGRNFGHQIALRAGLQSAEGDVVAVIDADLQDPPEVLLEMIRKWAEGYDVVVGIRQRRKEGPVKRLLYYLFYRVFSVLAELEMQLDAGDFCVMDRRVVACIRDMHESRPFIRGLRSYVGFRQTAIPYERMARGAGKTKYSYLKLFGLAADGILSNSRVPLHFATVFGAVVAVAAFLAALLVLCVRIFPETARQVGMPYVPGTASTIIAVLFMGGVQLFCFGILGAYLGRIHENVMRRPLWTVRETLGLHVDDAGGVRDNAAPARASVRRS